MKQYNHKILEKKWQKVWDGKNLYQAVDYESKPKFYALVEFPYPSGDGLHLGHAFTNTILDILVRKKRMSGFNVLYPMGWDAFGLPTENYAIKTGVLPSVATEKNINNFKKQMKKLALAYDWDRELNTTDPSYYKWTQYIFLKFFKSGLAYKSESPVGWCPSCKIILANEEIVDGKCERCGAQIERRSQKQWILKITKYADCLAKDLDLVDYPTSAKLAQRNWIGRSEGALVTFLIDNTSSNRKELQVFTSRIDTIFGVTFIVLSPEHAISIDVAQHNNSVAQYLELAAHKTDRERLALSKSKTGVDTGLLAINPANGEKIPVWISDYVLLDQGTGAVMGVPGNNNSDRDFSQSFSLSTREIIKHGVLVNSGKYSGLTPEEARKRLVLDLKPNVTKKVMYHLRDWIFSRQHYWGEPIPIVECSNCGLVPVPEEQLPVLLPDVERYQPTETGESPLANIHEWVNTFCPTCGGPAKRETDTMPNWAGSSWYFLRYTDPKNNTEFASVDKMKYWMPVDLYLGGAEHTTLHLLYSRFWHKFLYDLRLVPRSEPYTTRKQHGIILAEDGTKMSKSKGNVINPDDMIEKYGCDTLRTYLAFMGPYNQTMPWSTSGIEGSRRFVTRLWKIYNNSQKIGKTSDGLGDQLNNTVKKVGNDIEQLKHNTAVASLMTFLNLWEKPGMQLSVTKAKKYLVLLSPFMPYLTDELWHVLDKNSDSIHTQKWPVVSSDKTSGKTFRFIVMVNNKKRALISVPNGADRANVKNQAMKEQLVVKHLGGKNVKKVVFVKNRMINFVTE